MESFNDVFLAVKDYCAQRMVQASYKLFLDPMEAGSMDGDTVTLYVANEWLQDTVNNRFKGLLTEAFEDVLGFTVLLNIAIKPTEEEAAEEVKPVNSGEYAFTFDTFIVGSSNKFAHAAALAVAQNPSNSYNPLFIHGDSGLGKTHLLNAIRAEILKNNPGANIVYVSGEDFTNEIIAAIKDNKTSEFKNKYRQADVLLVDDIQFIAGRESTQEEFFHTFNALHNAGKQIVLVSDRPPKEIKSLEDRLRNRFEWGLIADIRPPDFETRCAIIKRKSDLLGMDIKFEVIEFIASKVKTNIRQLEGVVKKLDAMQKLEGKPPIMANAQAAIKDILNEQMSTPVTIEKIITDVCKVYNVTAADVRSQKRKREISEARQMAMHVVKEVCGLTMEEIGKEFGGRDHSTVVYTLKQVDKKIKTNSFFRDTVEDIIKNVKTL
ncbi:MAG: chromosomal replication initiator protein DnaA [Oscillospiraceae bacterium]|nr:chromosomal replication initiator protein DnaA [Oscillospiraceae bacterium]